MLRLRKHRVKRDVLGFRLPMLVHEEPELDITEISVIDPDNTYYMRMGSEAMLGYHILPDNILVIDRSLVPVAGSIVAFFHEGSFYVREYLPEGRRLVLRGDVDMVIEDGEHWVCWGVVMLTLNPVLQPQHKIGRYARVCAC